ncbi:MAG TPA: hypothetical protein VFZ34_00950, partial [Blastocatellia bacterium]|nr:hypothetical protein [Blastocatellia bacterium]
MNVASLCPTSLQVALKAVLALVLLAGAGLSQDLRARLKAAAAAASEVELQKVETAAPRSEEAALAKLMRGYLRLQAKDYSGALQMLDETTIMHQTKLGDYALYYRAQALQGANRIEDAEQAYVRVASTYPTSNLARTAVLQAAGSAMGRGAFQSVVNYVEKHAAANDGTALKLKADALEKMGKLEEAATTWRRLYFEAPQAPEASDVANKLTALGAAP